MYIQNILFFSIVTFYSSFQQEIGKYFTIYVEEFEHVTYRYPNHVCCQEETDLRYCSQCAIYFEVSSNFGATTVDGDDRARQKFTYSSYYHLPTNDIGPCMNISVNVREWYTEKIIDSWRTTCLTLQPNEVYYVNSQLGLFKNMKATFRLFINCTGYAGPGCSKPCMPTSLTYCDYYGNLQCIDGFIDPPNCRLDSPCSKGTPCEHGGSCIALSSTDYECKCTELYTGKRCNFLKCDENICKGSCQNGECVCTAETIDSTCTSYECDGNFICKNNGTCGKFNDEIFCICPPGTSGSYCQFNCVPSCVNGRCTIDNKGNDICLCYNGYIGIDCTERLIEIVSDKKSGLSTGAITGIVIAVLVGVCSLSCGLYFLYGKYHHLITLPYKNTSGDQDNRVDNLDYYANDI